MRKVKHNIQSNNPAVMFAAGLESLISDPFYQPSKFDEHELAQQTRASRAPKSRGNLFASLLKQFARF